MAQRCKAIFRLSAFRTLTDEMNNMPAIVRQFFSYEAAEKAGDEMFAAGRCIIYNINIERF